MRLKKEGSKNEYVRFRVSEDEKNFLRKLAFETGLSESSFLRKRVFGDREEEQKKHQDIQNELINIRREMFIISKLLVKVMTDLYKVDEQIIKKKLPEETRKILIKYVDDISTASKKIK